MKLGIKRAATRKGEDEAAQRAQGEAETAVRAADRAGSTTLTRTVVLKR